MEEGAGPEAEETELFLRQKLELGWKWLKENPDGPEKDAFFDRYLEVLSEYTRRYQEIWNAVEQLRLLDAPEKKKKGSGATKKPSRHNFISER